MEVVPLGSAGEIAAGIIAAKGFPDTAHLAVTKMVVARLNVLAGRGELAKTGKTRDARWARGRELSRDSPAGRHCGRVRPGCTGRAGQWCLAIRAMPF